MLLSGFCVHSSSIGIATVDIAEQQHSREWRILIQVWQ